MSSAYQTAKDQGYSDEEINEYLKSKDPKFEEQFQSALDEGYSSEEVYDFLGKKKKDKMPWDREAKEYVGEPLRHAARTVARGTEAVLGAPRALGEFGERLVPETLLKKGAEKLGIKEPVEKGLKFAKEHAPYKLLPTSEQVRDFQKTIFGKKLEPQSPVEEVMDDITTEFTLSTIPFSGKKVKLLRPFLTTVGANLASEIVGAFGGSKEAKDATKIGAYGISALINPKAADKAKSELYNLASEARPERVKVAAKLLPRELNTIERNLAKGGSAPWKDKLFKKINEIRKNMTGNTIEVGELERFKSSVNDIISELYAEKNVGKEGIKSAQRYINQIAKSIDNGLSEYGKVNPKWEKVYREANSMHGAIAQSKKARNMIGRVLKKHGKHLLFPLFGLGHVAGPAVAGKVIAGTAMGGVGLAGSEMIVKAWKNPKIRKLYGNIIKAAVRDEGAKVETLLEKMEKEVQNQK